MTPIRSPYVLYICMYVQGWSAVGMGRIYVLPTESVAVREDLLWAGCLSHAVMIPSPLRSIDRWLAEFGFEEFSL